MSQAIDMSNVEELVTEDGKTLKEYDAYNYFSLEELRLEAANIFDEEHELTEEELIGIVDYIIENRYWFIQDAAYSVFHPLK